MKGNKKKGEKKKQEKEQIKQRHRPEDDQLQTEFKQFYKKTSQSIIYQGELMCGIAAINESSADSKCLNLRELYKNLGAQLALIDKCQSIVNQKVFPSLEVFKSKELPKLNLFPTCLLNMLQNISAYENSSKINPETLKTIIKFILSSYKLLSREINDLIDRRMNEVYLVVDEWLRKENNSHEAQEQMQEQQVVSYQEFLNQQANLMRHLQNARRQQQATEYEGERNVNIKNQKTEMSQARIKYKNPAKILEPFTNWIYFSMKYCNLHCEVDS